MPRSRNESDVYYIPPNFIEGGTLFGGMLKFRNVIEAGIIGLAVGLPVLRLPLSLTTRIIILCLTAMPLALVAVIGVSGESLSSFALNFLKFFRNRRVVGAQEPPKERVREKRQRRERQPKAEKRPRRKRLEPARGEISEEFDSESCPMADFGDFPEEFEEPAGREGEPPVEDVPEAIPEEFPEPKRAGKGKRRKKTEVGSL